MGTACPGVERTNQRVFKLSYPGLESKDCFKYLLLVLDFEGVCSKEVLKM